MDKLKKWDLRCLRYGNQAIWRSSWLKLHVIHFLKTQNGVIGAWSRSNQIAFFGVQNWGAI